jgi:hypothetical protein
VITEGNPEHFFSLDTPEAVSEETDEAGELEIPTLEGL